MATIKSRKRQHEKQTSVTDEDTNDDNEDGRVPITAPIRPRIPTAMETATSTENYKNGIDRRLHPSTTTTNIASLPDNLSLQFFTFLTISDLGNVQSASRRWNTIVNADNRTNGAASWLWKRVYELRFRCRVSTLEPDWKSNCRHRLTRAAGCSRPRDFSTWCSSIAGDVDGDDDYAGFEFITEHDKGPTAYFGYTNSIRCHHQLFELHAGTEAKADVTKNENGWSYFEATVWGEGSVGIVSIETEADRMLYGDGSQLHIGWKGLSYGYHNDDGFVYIANNLNQQNRQRNGYNYRKVRYGPLWGRGVRQDAVPVEGQEAGDGDVRDDPPSVVGCGYNLATNNLFFTLDGAFLDLVPSCKTNPGVAYAAAVTLHNLGDRVRLNLGQFPFVFNIDHYCFESRERAI